MSEEWTAVWITLKLAGITTVWLLLLGTPLAWWLARGRSYVRTAVEAIVALPLILPPTVLGFYLLIAFAPQSPPGQLWEQLTGSQLAFTFNALVIGSIVYSLPFVVQPLQTAFRQLPTGLLEAAATMGAGRLDRCLHVILPLCRRSFIAAASLGFAHTVGEFGVVLMIGGNIPGETQVLSIALFDQVESLQFDNAHRMAAGLMVFSFVLLFLLYRGGRKDQWGLGQ